MGISIEQYLSSIGSHDNFVKTKDILSRFNDHIWNIKFSSEDYNTSFLNQSQVPLARSQDMIGHCITLRQRS